MFGAYRLILTSYYMLSAVVSLIPFSWAHIKSFSFLMGFEYTMFSKETPALMLDQIYAFEAQSMPAPLFAKSRIKSLDGLDLMAQCGLIQGSDFFQALIFFSASTGL